MDNYFFKFSKMTKDELERDSIELRRNRKLVPGFATVHYFFSGDILI